MRIVSWNIARRPDPWRLLSADPSLDVALLQEATPPPKDVTCSVWPEPYSGTWMPMPGYTQAFRTVVARLSSRVTMWGRRTTELGSSDREALRVSLEGALTVAHVQWEGETITCISAYGAWQNMLHDPPRKKPVIFADGAVHRLISDISGLLTDQTVRAS
jgi:hypothetical protein